MSRHGTLECVRHEVTSTERVNIAMPPELVVTVVSVKLPTLTGQITLVTRPERRLYYVTLEAFLSPLFQSRDHRKRSVLFSGPSPHHMVPTREKAQLMSASEIDRTLVRLAHEILEKTEDLHRLAFIGIRRRGVPLALRLAEKIKNLENLAVPVGFLDINLYRDDLSTVSEKPVHNATEINFPVTGKDIILMDDVLYTGRTIRAALDALFDQGRPSRVQLLVLIDRGWRELPDRSPLCRPHGPNQRQ